HPAKTYSLLAAILIATLGLSSILHAQTQPGYRVVDVVVEGNRIATNSLILGVADVKAGTDLTPTLVAEAIRRLYGLGIFSNVRIEAEDVLGGLKVFIAVNELPKLAGIEFSGNDKIKSKDFKEKLGLGIGGYISPFLIFQAKNKIKELYAEKGFFQAEAAGKLEYKADSTEAVLKFDIDEKSKVKVETVVITGNKRVESGNLVSKMRNRKRGFLKSSDFAQDKYAEDLEKVIAELHKRGFIDAYLIDDSMHIDQVTNRMTIYLDLYEGPQYYFGEATVKRNEKLRAEYLTKKLKYKPFDVFNSEKYEESLYELYTAYQDIGHLHVRIQDEKSTRADSMIDISYDISEGLPSHIRLVKIVGNTKTKDKVIRREISVLPDQVFNRSLLIRSVRDVMALNYFANAQPDLIDLPSGDVDVEFKIEEKQTGEIMAGAGYNSQDKLVGNVGMGIPNFRGMGQRLSFNIEFGTRRNSFQLSFTEPWLLGRPTLLGADIFALNRRWFDDYTEGRRGGSMRIGRRLKWPDNYFRAFVSYRIEENRFYDFDDFFIRDNSFKTYHFYYHNDSLGNADTTVIADVGNPYPGSIILYNEDWKSSSQMSFTVTRDSRNLPEFATTGSDISYTISQTGGPLGGFWQYQKHEISVAKFIPIIGSMALAAKLQYGVVTSPKGDDKILVSERFTPGGTAYDGVVRGYDDGSLTPDTIATTADQYYYYNGDPDSSGLTPYDSSTAAGFKTRVRGKYMLVSNLELQVPIVSRQIYALAFFDAGNSWLHKRDIKPLSGLYKSYGFGFRIAVPGIGTLGFDFGKPLDEVEGHDKKWKPHFQIGTTFK
ncbi:MAG: outer membrane protein assembly factor BamA, partial [Candidatus Zixiibacteriota bacterium]